jgi:hypothetical protein
LKERVGKSRVVSARAVATTTAVIARLDRAIQYSEAVVIESMGRGVLDAPPLRGMTAEG